MTARHPAIENAGHKKATGLSGVASAYEGVFSTCAGCNHHLAKRSTSDNPPQPPQSYPIPLLQVLHGFHFVEATLLQQRADGRALVPTVF